MAEGNPRRKQQKNRPMLKADRLLLAMARQRERKVCKAIRGQRAADTGQTQPATVTQEKQACPSP